MAININNLASEINRQLALYANQTEETVNEIAEKVAIKGVEELKEKSPKRYGDYEENWTYKRVGKKFILHNKNRYRLTHLLEKGHAKVNGGRVRAIPHIRPVEQNLIGEFEDELRQGMSE